MTPSKNVNLTHIAKFVQNFQHLFCSNIFVMNEFTVIRKIGEVLDQGNFPSLKLKPRQVKCFEYILHGFDVIAILPTGFGKSLLYQLLPDFLPCKGKSNIVLVISLLTLSYKTNLKFLKTVTFPPIYWN